jgi:hypothetical protein
MGDAGERTLSLPKSQAGLRLLFVVRLARDQVGTSAGKGSICNNIEIVDLLHRITADVQLPRA